MYVLIDNKRQGFTISYDVEQISKDKHNVKTYRFSAQAGNIKEEDVAFLRKTFFNVPLFSSDIKQLCEILNEKTSAYSGTITITLMATAKHTFKFMITEHIDKSTRVAISLSPDQYNQLINIHAETNNKSLSATLKEIYLLGLAKQTLIGDIEDAKILAQIEHDALEHLKIEKNLRQQKTIKSTRKKRVKKFMDSKQGIKSA